MIETDRDVDDRDDRDDSEIETEIEMVEMR